MKTVILDLDGTLVHTLPDIASTLNLVLSDAGYPPLDEVTVSSMIGGGIERLIYRAFASFEDPQAEAFAPQRADVFLAYALRQTPVHSTVYPGVVQTLDRLRNSGIRLAVCTNKTSVLARAVLRQTNLLHYMDAVIGGGVLPLKPDPAPIYEAVQQAGGSIDHTLMIGDSETDYKAANNAGIPCILVSYGYHHGRLSALRPHQIVDQFHDVYRAVSEIWAARG